MRAPPRCAASCLAARASPAPACHAVRVRLRYTILHNTILDYTRMHPVVKPLEMSPAPEWRAQVRVGGAVWVVRCGSTGAVLIHYTIPIYFIILCYSIHYYSTRHCTCGSRSWRTSRALYYSILYYTILYYTKLHYYTILY